MLANKAGGKQMAANQEHLDILVQGVKMWNQWRGEHADVEVDLSGANLSGANLSGANLSGADLSVADLNEANLSGADLSGADLSFANLIRATLIQTNFAEATLTNCKIYGISAWSVELKGATQNNLEITPYNEPTITVD